MTNEELQKKIDAANDKMLGDEDNQPVIERPDIYRDNLSERREFQKLSTPKGSRKKVQMDANELVARLAPAYRKANDDSDCLAKRGDKQYSRMVKQQYMEENFLPTVDALVRLNSADEVLNAKEVLKTLDEMVLIDGGSGSGYTSSYIRSAYADNMGKTVGSSDGEVVETVKKIVMLVGQDQIRVAVGMANRIKDKVDSGKNMASNEDYAIIQRVAMRGK